MYLLNQAEFSREGAVFIGLFISSTCLTNGKYSINIVELVDEFQSIFCMTNLITLTNKLVGSAFPEEICQTYEALISCPQIILMYHLLLLLLVCYHLSRFKFLQFLKYAMPFHASGLMHSVPSAGNVLPFFSAW